MVPIQTGCGVCLPAAASAPSGPQCLPQTPTLGRNTTNSWSTGLTPPTKKQATEGLHTEPNQEF